MQENNLTFYKNHGLKSKLKEDRKSKVKDLSLRLITCMRGHLSTKLKA